MEGFNIRKSCADPTCTVDNILQIVKRIQVNDINKNRMSFSEYHHLFPLLKQYEKKFETYMRMKPRTFDYILSKVNDSLTKCWCNLHTQPIKPEEKLVVTIRFLTTGVSYSDLSFSFLMGKSTIKYLVEDVLTAIWRELQPLHMPVPTQNMFMDIAKEYNLLWCIPHCLGAIDVRHIRIKKPDNSGSRYYNHKNFHSITLQAITDARYRFIVIDVGGYGHQHDATTFRYSSLYRALKAKKLKIPKNDKLPYFFIGDGAYPLSKNSIKPYPGKHLSRNERLFNGRLSRARVCIECAFGRLCQKWQIFYRPIQHELKNAELIVKGACILHNVIIDLEKSSTVVSFQSLAEASVLVADERETDEVLIGDGEIVRKKLTKIFGKNPIQQ